MSQHISIMTPDLGAMTQPAAMDPDIMATLSDFLTYTEHLPSAVVRSMTLIETLNKKAAALQREMHDLLSTYSALPTMDTEGAPDPVDMRRDISHAYDKLAECKRMSAAEAARIEDLVTRDARRLDMVSEKLKALPMPPSRDATPDPVPVRSDDQLKRRGQSLSQAHQSADKRVAAHRTTTAPRVRNRDKLMVPGEVLPPPNPDSPPPSEPDDWLDPATPSADIPEQTPRQKSVARQRTPKPPRPPKPDKDSNKESNREPNKDKPQKTPRARPPGMPGTNAHSAVAGISTSNAIMALTRPPDDAPRGSKWLPWKALTEYELATLRKKMKKNAAWKPSIAMKNRELKDRGRGTQAMEDRKLLADTTGSPFHDVDLATWVDPTKTLVSGEQQAEVDSILGPEEENGHFSNDDTMINRGMRLNEAKKLKRERQKADDLAGNDKPSADRPSKPQKPNHQDHARKPAKPKPTNNVSETKPFAKLGQQPGLLSGAVDQPNVLEPPASPAPPVGNDAEKRTESDAPALPAESTARKRKRDPSPHAPSVPQKSAVEPPNTLSNQRAAPEKKKLKLNPPAPPHQPPTSDHVPAVASPKPTTPADPTPRASARSRSQRASVAPAEAQIPPPPTTRSGAAKTGTTIILKRPQKAASAEPPIRKALRRASNASLPGGGKKSQSPVPKKGTTASRQSRTPRQSVEPTSATSATTRPKRRPAPGVVAAREDGSAAVSIGKRKKPPVKKQAQQNRGTPALKKDEAAAVVSAAEEEVDPNEEHYCICGDVSWGPMICCDNANVSFSS